MASTEVILQARLTPETAVRVEIDGPWTAEAYASLLRYLVVAGKAVLPAALRDECQVCGKSGGGHDEDCTVLEFGPNQDTDPN